MGGTQTTPNDNGNPFDAPFEQPQQSQVTTSASDNGNPFDAPFEQPQQANPGAPIAPVTTSTNPKLAAAMSAKEMPEYVGAVGALGAGAMGGEALSEAATPVLKHIATEYGAPAMKAITEAAKAHPIVAEVLKYGLGTMSTLKASQYLKLFTGDSKK
jgi:hypothetical protein